MSPILEIKGISKKFNLRQSQPYRTLRDSFNTLLTFKQSPTDEFWALNDVSFDVSPGDSIGIIGRNGAGKSTLLKILSKIIPPTQGKIIKRGRLASLIEVGTGFHPELTGRENIYFNGSILGMKKKEIEAKFDEIVDFAGTERFLETQLKNYSSGMQLRLAFAVSAFLEPEILVIDEVLAVGDAEFQKKCLGKMEDVTKSGRTILFVSHNMAAVENLCSKAILLDNGKLVMESDVPTVLRKYQQQFAQNMSNSFTMTSPNGYDVYFNSIDVEVSGKQPNYKLRVACDVTSVKSHKDSYIAIDIVNSLGVAVMQAIPTLEPFIKFSTSSQRAVIDIDLPPLIPDTYRVSVWIGPHNTETICWLREVVSFEIPDSPTNGRTFPHTHDHGFVVPNSRIVK
ncbi:MAG TPA: polysaccharide ABC transporter ATP-binding protein [Cyclobacteriaceae bacterium]|nr:polysaccharide ABC transporter ATP-binding protein [Cyclobacteriaceae bacterium]